MSLAGEITSRLGLEATPIPGSTGQFDILVDGALLFSKRAEGRFPEESEILARLSQP